MSSKRCDVLVVGGGASGTAAACAAARAGAETVLVERLPFVGGMATAAYVGTICGLFFRSPSGARYVSDGFASSFAEELKVANDSIPTMFDKDLWYLPYSLTVFQSLLELHLERAKVDVVLHATVCRARASDQCVRNISVQTLREELEFQPQTIIDCSGEAVVAALSGGSFAPPEHPQAAAIVFEISGLVSSGANLRTELYLEINRAVQDKRLGADCLRFSIVPGGERSGRLLCKLAVDHPGSSARDLTRAEQHARKLVRDLFRELKKSLGSIELSYIAPQLGVRTARRAPGRYTLSEDDVVSAKKFPGSLARGVWPIEFWTDARQPEMRYLAEESYYDIPDDALRSSEFKNLFFAGRAISASERAAASARVIGTCFSSGEAAGILAAAEAGIS